MPLRRVTLSGRLAGYESEEPEPVGKVVLKGLLAVAFDVTVALGVATASFMLFMGKVVAPYERGFYCYEVDALSHPFRANTVSTRHLLSVALVVPLVCIFVVEAIFFRWARGSNKLRKYFYAVTFVYLEYAAAYTLAMFIMEATKCTFARLRPHYLSVCKPDWSQIDCSDGDAFIENAHCTSTDAHRIRIGRQSFPSGHSIAAAVLLTFLYVYLTDLVKVANTAILRNVRRIFLLVATVWTVLVLVTRVTDYWHHISDVLGGAAIGFCCVYFPLGRKDPKRVYSHRYLQNINAQ